MTPLNRTSGFFKLTFALVLFAMTSPMALSKSRDLRPTEGVFLRTRTAKLNSAGRFSSRSLKWVNTSPRSGLHEKSREKPSMVMASLSSSLLQALRSTSTTIIGGFRWTTL
ncbi:MAG: hypothetical protein DRJ68_01580 [Thermoprotei archaeon]|nr:MAG: hypothetical protein DRJ68_01580 [Thermoprotei archaeon]